MHHKMAKIPELQWHRATMDTQVPAPLLPHPGRCQESRRGNYLNHPSLVIWCLCLHFRIDLRQAHAGGVVHLSALETGLAFDIWEFQKAKSLLDTEMLCSSFQINFCLIIWTEWNQWCWQKKICLEV